MGTAAPVIDPDKDAASMKARKPFYNETGHIPPSLHGKSALENAS
jgi:hypothetical protein